MSEPWYVRAFRADYLDVYAHRDEAAAGDEIAFVAEALRAGPAARLLDAGCGAGRHARALARRGAVVVGLDLSADLLAAAAAARAGDARGGPGPRYVRSDLRALPFRAAAFDGVASLFTSFGYFADASDDLRQLCEVRRVLRAAGRLVLDFLNAARVAATLVPRSTRDTPDGARVEEERRIEAGRVWKAVRMRTRDGRDRAWVESVRLYTPSDLVRLLEAAGLRVVGSYGDLAGAALDAASSPRCVVVAEAP